MNAMNSFHDTVLNVVRSIKKGSVLSYGEVARRAGNPKASRAVGFYMAKNIDITVPCHRVVRSDGSIGEYNGLRGKSKKDLLLDEGIVFGGNGKVVV